MARVTWWAVTVASGAAIMSPAAVWVSRPGRVQVTPWEASSVWGQRSWSTICSRAVPDESQIGERYSASMTAWVISPDARPKSAVLGPAESEGVPSAPESKGR